MRSNSPCESLARRLIEPRSRMSVIVRFLDSTFNGFIFRVLVKCSRKIDLKFRAKISEKLSDLGINGFLRPSDETPPVILCVLPDDFDQVQLGTVWRQIEEHHAMFDEPAVDRFLIDVVMNRGVVKPHPRHQSGLSFLRDLIKELNDGRTF